MAPAACDTIERNLQDFRRTPSDYDRIITGDLGAVGKRILLEMCIRDRLDSYKAFDTGSVAKQTVQVHFLDPIYPEEYQGMKTTRCV